MCLRLKLTNIVRNIFTFLFVLLILPVFSSSTGKEKRQLFRENLLPQVGGKIPESAFYHDRLSLNRLNQNGIYTSDGVYLEQRPALHAAKNHLCKTMKIIVQPNNVPRMIDTSYLIREPVKYSIVPSLMFRAYAPPPTESLRLLHSSMQYKIHNNNNNKDAPRKDRILSFQILYELAPYINKFLY